MTRLQGCPGLPDSGRSSSNGDWDWPSVYPSRLPADAPEAVAKHTVTVTDPARIYDWTKDDRRRNFNLIVKRYKNQLLYGCKEPSCTTPTCFSCRKRVADVPVRRFTDLSARTIACYLASQDNPERGLCRHEPITKIDSLAHDGSGFRSPASPTPNRKGRQPTSPDRHGNSGNDGGFSGFRGDLQDAADFAEGDGSPTEKERPSSPAHDGSHDAAAEAAKDTKRLKDPKSFTQNLFDTLALRMVEWLPLKRTPDAYNSHGDQTGVISPLGTESRRNLSGAEQQQGRRFSSVSTRTVDHAGNGKPPPSHPSTIPASTTATAVELKIPGSPIKRLSLGELEHRRPPLRTLTDERSKHDRKPVRKLTATTPSTTTPRCPPSPPPLRHRPRRQKSRSQDLHPSHRTKAASQRSRAEADARDTRYAKQIDDEFIPDPPSLAGLPPSPPISTDASALDATIPQDRIRHIQSLTRLSKDIIDGLEEMFFETEEERERWDDEMRELASRGYTEPCNWKYAARRQRQLFPFVAQSVFYVFSSPRQLLESFGPSPKPRIGRERSPSRPRLDVTSLEESFRKLYHICPLEVTLNSLWMSLEKFFVLPKEFSTSWSHSRRSIRCSSPSDAGSMSGANSFGTSPPSSEYISDADAAHVLVVVLSALASSVPPVDSHAWQAVRLIRSSGTVLPDHEIRKRSEASAQLIVDVTDKFEHRMALRLINRLARVVAARLAFHQMSKTRAAAIQDQVIEGKKPNVVDLVLQYMEQCAPGGEKPASTPFESSFTERTTTMPMVTVEWLRGLLLKEWDGNPVLSKSSAAGGALQMLASMYRDRVKLSLQPEDFHTPFLSERLDPMEMPVEWLGILPNNRSMHLLSYPFMFPPSALVLYFRALNYSTMSKFYENAMTASRHVTQTAFSCTIPIEDDVSLLARLKTSISTYLVLVIRRDNVLVDALNQLWRRERRELLRPLKVQMGMDEGEEGVDHGGVQQEFFRVAMAEAMNPSYGMFTADSRTGISWFQPCSLEPLYKFELLGLLMSLAVYNGLTIPVNFPIALYRKLLGLKVKNIDHISVGWADLAKGLEDLLSWTDGDVGDIFMRTYEFSFEAFGRVITLDMERTSRNDPWPPARTHPWDWARPGSIDRASFKGKNRRRNAQEDRISLLEDDTDEYGHSYREMPPYGILKGGPSRQRATPARTNQQEEPSLVTNANREEFVKDYIFWLTDKSVRPQYEAFARGFYTCLDRTALSLFTPEALKSVVEGIQEIDIGELQRHARYEGGFDPNHRVIKDFWHIVKRYSQKKRSQLLEFVTSCDRVPVSGISSIMFVIQKNGTGDSRLPTSLTCFGRLLLPEYSSRSALEEKLDKALENAKGFGVA